MMHRIRESASAMMTEYQIAIAPKMAGSTNTQPSSNTIDLVNADTAEITPLPYLAGRISEVFCRCNDLTRLPS